MYSLVGLKQDGNAAGEKIILAGKYVLGPLDFSRSSEMILGSGPPPALMASGLAYLSLPASTPSFDYLLRSFYDNSVLYHH
ncbi:hypothetical protein [Ensifer aridi]|uniref:hypothetical protein n=1 Tax=Ensifer aridi TaxID=1708715 RepID=UPI001111811F|nr:hypothetical protein [Ensifer aridi]